MHDFYSKQSIFICITFIWVEVLNTSSLTELILLRADTAEGKGRQVNVLIVETIITVIWGKLRL